MKPLTFNPPPIDFDSNSLLESIMPTRWEHLNGPFRWFEPIGEVQETPKGKRVLPVRVIGDIGPLAKRLARTQRQDGRPTPPSKLYLFHGPAGMGKSVFEELLGRTFLASSHTPVTVTDEEGEEIVIVDEDFNPFVINPPHPDEATDDSKFVRRALASERLDTTPCVKPYNTDDMNVDEVRDMVQLVKRANMPGKRNLFFLGEIDALKGSQTKAIKTGLDPNKGVPDGVLILADTNNLEKARKNLAEGIERFEIIGVEAWDRDTLAHYAWHYTTQFGTEFDFSSFENEYEPYYAIADHTEGMMRRLIRHLDAIRDYDFQLGEEKLFDILTKGAPAGYDISRDVHHFFNLPRYDMSSVASFCQRKARYRVNIMSFTNSVLTYVMQNCPEIYQNDGVPEAAERLMTLAGTSYDGLEYAFFSAAVKPLTIIGYYANQTHRQRRAA